MFSALDGVTAHLPVLPVSSTMKMNISPLIHRAVLLHVAALAVSGAAWAQSEPSQLSPEVAPEIPTLRSPRAEEVGTPSGKGLVPGFAPLPGLPLDTTFDSVCWLPQGPGLTRLGDANIAPDHPTSGCVTCVVPHPTDQNTLYIGTANGGVWKTTNALSTNVRWKPLTDDQLSLSIGGLARDTSDATGNTLVAGFGRRSSFGGRGGAQKGLLRTTDGGTTWTKLGETAMAGRAFVGLAVRGSTFLMAVLSTDNGTLPGLYLTTDTGATFTNISGLGGSGLPAGAVTHLAGDPSNLSRFYVHVASNGVYRSTNSGVTWTNISAGNAAANVASMALAVGNDGTLFAAELAGTSRVYRSTNQGGTWTQMDSVLANTGGNLGGFTVDPVNSNICYLSGLYVRATFPFSGRVVRGNASLAAGSQWASIASTSGLGVGTAPHTDSRVLAFNIGNRLIEGDDGGIYELNIANVGSEGDGAGGGGMWRSLNGDLRVCEMHSVAYDRVSRIFIGGSQDTAFQEQQSPGIPVAGTAGWKNTSNGDGGDAAIDFLTTPGQSIRYGSSQFLAGFFRAIYDANNNQISRAFPATTLTGGGTAIVRGGASNNMPFTTPLAMNAVAGGRLIISGNSNVYESLDQGNTVTQIDTGFGMNQLTKIAYGGKLSGVAVPGVVFYGQGANIRYRTAASGAVTNTIANPGGTVQSIAFDPENWKTAFIVGTTAVYSANDIPANGAAAFTNITGNLTGVGTFHTIDYLTLPGGNAIMVGTDLGAYIMRVASPGVWKTLGDNLPHAPVYDAHFDAAGQVLAVTTLGRGAFLYDFKPTKTTGQYGETFQAYTDGTSVLAPGAGELFSNQLGTTAKVTDANERMLQLTADGTGGTFTAFRLPDLNPGAPITAFSAKWNATIYGDGIFDDLADGFSFNFGPLGTVTGAAFTDGTFANEDGFNAGLTVSVRTYVGATPGYYVRVNGTTVPGGFVSKPSANWGSFDPTRHVFEVDWRIDTGLTLRVDGVPIFTNLATPGYIPAAGHRFVFGARTGGSVEECRLDNIAIISGGVLTPIPAIAPYQFSSDFPGPGQTADKTFDGNAATKWLTLDYTGFIGASFSAAKTVRAYTLTASEDVPARDPAAWDFQTGNDGVLWTQHGAQCAQFFQNRGERRTFVVANPAANSKFRMLISENHEAAEIQLSEFQPWELTPVPPQIIVTNANDSGVGSLRRAVADAAAFTNAVITFAPALSGGTITLASEIVAATPLGATIDASALSAGLTIDGGAGTNRLFAINGGATLNLTALTLTGGDGTGSFANDAGGAIFNAGTLALDRCTLAGNSSTLVGGAINNVATLNLTRCTFANNGSSFGGALSNYSLATLTHCTLAGNSASSNGGGIDNGNGAGIVLTLANSIIAGNTASFGSDINNFNGTVTRVGANLVQGYTGVPATGGGTISNAAPLLAPLDNYGGPTKTRALILNSPARNTSVGSAITSDQRGFPIVSGTPDIGAYEAGTLTNYNAWIWETLPASATNGQHLAVGDYDGDGATNGDEFIALTNPTDVASRFRIVSAVRNAVNLDVTFTSVVGRHYSLEYTSDFASYVIPATGIVGTGSPITIPLGPVTGFPRFFVRARVGP